MPCQHVVIDTIAEHSGKTFERYGTPGVCPSCQEPVTRRQRVITFERNLYGLGTVTFHLREKCRHAAFEYDREVHRDDGEFELTCPGSARRGLDENGLPVTYCTEPDCRGADRKHHGYGFWTAGVSATP